MVHCFTAQQGFTLRKHPPYNLFSLAMSNFAVIDTEIFEREGFHLRKKITPAKKGTNNKNLKIHVVVETKVSPLCLCMYIFGIVIRNKILHCTY